VARTIEPVDIELLVIPDCPNEGAAAAQLRQALDDVGLTRVPIRTHLVDSLDEARRLGFVGSPTVRIDGEDPFDEPAQLVGLACRVYETGEVRSGVPDLRRLRQALQRHADMSG
jgi:hypothetical protein